MASVELPELPKDRELEDYVAALYQSTGYYVEKNIEETTSGAQVLELDIVATRFEGLIGTSHIAEVKSGACGFGDVFKLRGQMEYLGIPFGSFFITKTKSPLDQDLLVKKSNSLSIDLVYLPEEELRKESPSFQSKTIGAVVDPALFRVLRYANWMERELKDALFSRQKSQKTSGLQAAWNYFRVINNETFFENDVRDRAEALYSAYKSHPKLTGALAAEMDGGPFDPVSPGRSERVRRCLIDGGETVLQCAMYFEHRARLSLFKAVVDYAAAQEAGQLDARGALVVGGKLLAEWTDFLPPSFVNAARRLATRPEFPLYPRFWQVFLWAWGGFYLLHRKDEEFAALASATGLEPGQVQGALDAYDLLFPMPDGGSWLYTHSAADIVLTKMVPMCFQGLGAFHRRLRMNGDDLGAIGGRGYTTRNLT